VPLAAAPADDHSVYPEPFESVASGPLVRSSYHADLLAGTVQPGEASRAG
jgi:hypothetical protein